PTPLKPLRGDNPPSPPGGNPSPGTTRADDPGTGRNPSPGTTPGTGRNPSLRRLRRLDEPAPALRGQAAHPGRRAGALGDLPGALGDGHDPQPAHRVTVDRETGQVGYGRPGQLGRVLEQQHALVPAAEREGGRLVVPADAVPRAEPGHRAPRVTG